MTVAAVVVVMLQVGVALLQPTMWPTEPVPFNSCVEWGFEVWDGKRVTCVGPERTSFSGDYGRLPGRGGPTTTWAPAHYFPPPQRVRFVTLTDGLCADTRLLRVIYNAIQHCLARVVTGETYALQIDWPQDSLGFSVREQTTEPVFGACLNRSFTVPPPNESPATCDLGLHFLGPPSELDPPTSIERTR